MAEEDKSAKEVKSGAEVKSAAGDQDKFSAQLDSSDQIKYGQREGMQIIVEEPLNLLKPRGKSERIKLIFLKLLEFKPKMKLRKHNLLHKK